MYIFILPFTEYVDLYGKSIWSPSMYSGSTGLIRNYISPAIGSMKLTEITSRVLEKFYMNLLKTKAVPRITDRKGAKVTRYVTPSTVRKIHNLLKSCFHQAVKWDLIEKNPAVYATVPKAEEKRRDMWDGPTLFHAIAVCEDERLKMALNLSFAGSLRLGELLGLTWDCVDVTQESIDRGMASIFITKELQRTSKSTLSQLDDKDILVKFPEQGTRNKTVLVLKKPKTATSVRKIFLPPTVAQMLVGWKEDQDLNREMLGDEYQDFNLVMAGPMGLPMEGTAIDRALSRLIEEHDLPKVVFHSIRHTSITYKLKLSGGDIKAVQGDSGHAQAKMVTDQYSHILDDGRKENARRMEDAFYAGHGSENFADDNDGGTAPETEHTDSAAAAGLDAETLTKILNNPELTTLLKTLADKL